MKKSEKVTSSHKAILAVDPAKKFGAALFINSRLVRLWKGEQSIKKIRKILSFSSKKAEANGVKLCVVVETQYLTTFGKKGEKKKVNPKMMAALYKRRHEWEVIAEVWEIDYTNVYPVSWQVIHKLSLQKTTKAKSLEIARRKWPKASFDDNSADAACMGYWYTTLQDTEHPGIYG